MSRKKSAPGPMFADLAHARPAIALFALSLAALAPVTSLGCKSRKGAGESVAGVGGAPADASAPTTAGGWPAESRGSGPGAVGQERDPGAVATVAGKPLAYRSFERYLNDNAGEETDMGDSADAIKSRLLDQFIEEQILLLEAERLKIAVSEAEVDAYLKELGLSEGDLDVGTPDGKEGFRAKIRQTLTLQKVKDTAVLKTIHVSPGEVQDEMNRHPEAGAGSERFVLRQIMLEDKGTADETRRALLVDPGKFETLAREKSVAPDRGQPRGYAAQDLPAEVRTAVGSLEPGQVSTVVQMPSGFALFQLVKKEETKPNLDQVRAGVESALFRQKADQVMERYLADLRGKTEIHVNRAILPFRYTGENRN